ncbi:MAG: hypothetical protein IPM47_19175 [Sphingobacteriales bacterium]|nr:MAG: hypothetical protein IPM47_19175 [Sphingobacteriales bacterium]
MRSILYYLCLILLIPVLSYAQPVPDVGVSGVVKPKNKTVKPAKIKYQYHQGTAILKSGLIIHGKFKYTQPGSVEVPLFTFVENGTKTKKTVALSMLEKLTLEGAEKGITSRVDSTEFIWIDKYRDLYRKVRTGNIELYDNSRVVNEKYEYLTDYIFIAGKKELGYKLVRKLSDMETLMADRPYFMESAKNTNRYETQDFRVIVYLVDLYNDPDPMRALKWDEMTIVMKNRQLISGKGYLQPLDLRNEYIESTSAYVHFHDGIDFRLLSSSNIKDIIINGETLIGGVYAISNKYFYGKKWIHQGAEYAVVQRLVNTNNYFFKSRSIAEGIVILAKMGENYIKPADEAELRKAYIEYLRNSSASQ